MPAAERQSSPGVDALIALGVAVLYVAAARLGLALAVHAPQVSAVWPSTGFALAAVIIFGRRAIPGIFAGAFLANAFVNEPLWVAAGIGVGNTLEAVAGAAILRRLKFDTALARLRDVIGLLAAVTISPLVSATLGIAFLIGSGLHPPGDAATLWPVWWLGDALGGLIVTPLLLVWSGGHRPTVRRGLAEPLLMLGGLVVVGVVVFSRPPGVPVSYALYPFLFWAALRFGPTYTTTAALLANIIAIAGTLSGRGPFVGAGPEHGLVLVQMYMAVGATTALILGAVAARSRDAHQRAEVSEQRLRMAMAAARVGVWDWNIATGRITWSEGLEPLHGMAHGEFAGTYEAYRKTIHPEDLERVESLIRQSLETGQPYQAEFRLLGPDGVLRWTNARAIVLDDENGRASRMVGVGIDVTQQKQLEEELRLQHRRKDEFLAMLGHELRNPLAAIVHAVEALSSTDPEEKEEGRRVIRRQTGNLSRLVDDLLDVSRITRGEIQLQRRLVSVIEIVNSAADTWRHLIAQKGQHLTIDPPEAGMWIEGDPLRLTQIIANVIHNAAKFTPEGGAIAIRASKEGSQAVIRVRDDGLGMTPDVQAHAFELFVQGPRSLDRLQGGLGLGLTLVHRLAAMHGGTVEARSAGANRGTEVTVRLPLAAGGKEPALVTEGPRPAERTPSRRVLVVEDNADTRRMLVFMLRRDGHEVRDAADGNAALTAAQSFAPEVVLLDVGLPGMDGYSIARRLRGLSQTSNALLVALTGYGQAEDREKAFAAGFDHHLLKPADPDRVLALMREKRGSAHGDAGLTRSPES